MSVNEPWWETGLREVRVRTERLFAQMLESRPSEPDWVQFRHLVALLADLRDYALTHETARQITESEIAPEPEIVPEGPVESDDALTGTFVQGPIGGKLMTESGVEISVAPRIVAATALSHGDIVRAVREGSYPDGRPKYFFEKIRSVGGTNPDRREVVGFVQPLNEGEWAVQVNNLSVLVSAAELRESGAGDGDVVTAAYMASEICDGRVPGAILRVHVTEAPVRSSAHNPPRLRRPESAERVDREPAIRFVGRPKVVILGGFNWAYYRDGIAELGGSFAYLSGFSHERIIAGTVSGADIVVAITAHVSHKNYDKAKSVARDTGVPFYITDKQNWSGLRALFEQEIIPAWNTRANDAAD